MKAFKSDRGFVQVTHPVYPPDPGFDKRLVSESSMIGEYENSINDPGSSALWVGEDHLLNREEVADLIRRMQHWLDYKRLPLDEETAPEQQ